MKLNPSAAVHAYNKISERNAQIPRRTELPVERTVQRVAHTDKVQISPEGARKAEAQQLTRSIMAEIREPASPQRLESLRTAVANGSYHVPTAKLVDAVMAGLYS